MKHLSQLFGGVLLVAGTTIGAGMLALPVVTAFSGFFPSLLIFAICWLAMLCSAFFFLDVNLSIPGEINLITMAEKTLGSFGKGIAWIFYLLLLYALTAAYIAASAPIFQEAIQYFTGICVPNYASYFILPLLFGAFIYAGTAGVDFVNRMFMVGLLLSYCLLIFVLPEHIQYRLLLHIDWKPVFLSFPVIITSFGYHIIIPSLTTYLNHNKKLLKLSLLLGSILPLVFYLVWQFLIVGVVPLTGEISLANAWQEGKAAAVPLMQLLHNPYIRIGAQLFSFFALVTSFLGVSLSLSDFLTDGLNIKKTWEGRLLAILLTFIPPLFFVYTYKKGFYLALQYAGAFVAILLIFLPAAMAWKLPSKFYTSIWGKCLLVLVIIFAFFIIVVDVLERWDLFLPSIQQYVSVRV